MRHSLATIARNHGRSSDPARNFWRLRQALAAASWTASSASARCLSIAYASRNAIGSSGSSPSANVSWCVRAIPPPGSPAPIHFPKPYAARAGFVTGGLPSLPVDLRDLVRTPLHGAEPYDPGPSLTELRAKYGVEQIAKLNWNEDLFGLLPGVRDAIIAEISRAHFYPE